MGGVEDEGGEVGEVGMRTRGEGSERMGNVETEDFACMAAAKRIWVVFIQLFEKVCVQRFH